MGRFKKPKFRGINLEQLIEFRQKHTYEQTLIKYHIKTGLFWNMANAAFNEEGIVDKEEFNELFTIERPSLDWRYRDGKNLPRGVFLSRHNNVALIELALERIDMYAIAPRAVKVQKIREKVLNYDPQDEEKKNGGLQYFMDNGLGGLLIMSPHLSKNNSTRAVLEYYDRARAVGLFDRSQDEYLMRGELRERSMWKGEGGVELAIETLEDLLWCLPGYRHGSRDARVKIIMKNILMYEGEREKDNGVRGWIQNQGVQSMLIQCPAVKNSADKAFRLYDDARGTQLFNTNHSIYLRPQDFHRGRSRWIGMARYTRGA